MTHTQLNTDPDIPKYQNATGKLEYSLTNDYMFRAVMQNNEKMLRGLIGSLLGLTQDEILSVELTNPIILGNALGEKELILDLKINLNRERVLNIEMQVAKREDWPERSLIYLCRIFDNLKSGEDYSNVLPCLHIGIIDFDLFEDKEFYAKYRLMNVESHSVYTSKFGINVLNLRQVEQATEEDRRNKLDLWVRLFKAKTWEELKMLAETSDIAKEAAKSIYAVSEDEAIKLQCEARERYERDWASSYSSGRRTGEKVGIKEGVGSIIKSALSNGKTPEEIAEFNGIPLDEVIKYIEQT
ncbi:MAG: Rpn family recombination-promoting nuclease/putative transposase [Lachnospiraceae bacterium]|nr:Rpn family recombination-promoting nuclease/putative transposase [Lachnospiraceae bacterium]